MNCLGWYSEHAELVQNDLLNDDELLLVHHGGKVEAAILGLHADDIPDMIMDL